MKTDVSRMRLLAEKYFDGATTVEEEALMAEYFRTTTPEDVPQELRTLGRMLSGFAAIREEQMPDGKRRVSAAGRWKGWLIGAAAAAAAVILTVLPHNRAIYGYTAEGKAITSTEDALSQAGCLKELSTLEEVLNLADGLVKVLENE